IEDADLSLMPNTDVCETCHEEESIAYKQSRHSLKWSSFMYREDKEQQDDICTGCHSSKSSRYKRNGCNSCHMRHTFSKREANDPRICKSCHSSQWQSWFSSRHGILWQIGSKRKLPTCQFCHLPKGDHNIKTAGGYFALEMPKEEEEQQWSGDRLIILKALGVVDENGVPTERKELLSMDGSSLEKMSGICKRCHSSSYVEQQFKNCEKTIKMADRLMAEAIRIVNRLYEDGILKKPKGWKYAPDLMHIYNTENTIEQKLHTMFFNYRLKVVSGALHFNNEYTHWQGLIKMREALYKIKDESQELRYKAKLKI
ncbi:MAG: cytochrome C, partial [Nitrospirae bacterium]